MPYSAYAASVTSYPVSPIDVSQVTSPGTSCTATPAPSVRDESVGRGRRRSSLTTTNSTTTDIIRNRRSNGKIQLLQKRFKKALGEEDVAECLKAYSEIKSFSLKSL